MYWDFENLHAGLTEAKFGERSYSKPDTRFKVQEPVVDIQAIVELGSSFGPIAINRAYCNWQYLGRYRDALLQSAVELIQLFLPGASEVDAGAKVGWAQNMATMPVSDLLQLIEHMNGVAVMIVLTADRTPLSTGQKSSVRGGPLMATAALPVHRIA